MTGMCTGRTGPCTKSMVGEMVVDGHRELYDCLPGISIVAVAAIEGRLYLAKYTEGVDPGSTSVRLELVIVVIIHGFGFVVVVINGFSSINQQRVSL